MKQNDAAAPTPERKIPPSEDDHVREPETPAPAPSEKVTKRLNHPWIKEVDIPDELYVHMKVRW